MKKQHKEVILRRSVKPLNLSSAHLKNHRTDTEIYVTINDKKKHKQNIVLYFLKNDVVMYTLRGTREYSKILTSDDYEGKSLKDILPSLLDQIYNETNSKSMNNFKIYIVVPFINKKNKNYIIPINDDICKKSEQLNASLGAASAAQPNDEGFDDEAIYETVGPIYENVDAINQNLEDIYENLDPSHTQQHPIYGAAGEPEEFEAIKKGYEYSTSHHDKNLKLIIFDLDETITDVHSVGKFKILLNQMLSTKRSDDLTIHEYKQLCKEVENNIFKPIIR